MEGLCIRPARASTLQGLYVRRPPPLEKGEPPHDYLIGPRRHATGLDRELIVCGQHGDAVRFVQLAQVATGGFPLWDDSPRL
jgi:hypothetical protein